jgi:hypothetical protein
LAAIDAVSAERHAHTHPLKLPTSVKRAAAELAIVLPTCPEWTVTGRAE